MMPLKLLHCADLHLDAPLSSLGTYRGLPEKRRQELKLALSRIVDLAEEEAVDLLLVCGDLFEHDYVRRSTISFVYDEFGRIPEIDVLIIPGNHDPLVQGSYYCGQEWPENVHILSERSPVFISREHGACVYGDIKGKPMLDGSRINILMSHGTLDMNFSSNAYNHLSSRELDMYGFDYIALGHFHTKLEGMGDRLSIYNPGSPEPLGFDEEGRHGVFIVSIEKTESGDTPVNCSRVRADFRPIGTRAYHSVEVLAEGCATDEQASKLAEAAIADDRDLYSIKFTGTTAAGFRINTDLVGSLIKDRACFIKIKDSTRPDYDFESIAREPGLKGLFVREMLKKAADARDERGRQIAMQALYFGLEAIDQGRVTVSTNAY